MTFYLDTDTCVFFLRGAHPQLVEVLKRHKPERIKIPSMVAAELMLGAQRSRHALTAQKAVDAFLVPFEIVSFDEVAAEVYARMRAELEEKGIGVGPNDLVIAATVLAQHGVLVTHNIKEFSRIPGLKVEDWVAG